MIRIMPIVDLLWTHFDKLKRNVNGTIVYDKQFKEITENLLNHESLNSESYDTYDEFFNAVTNDIVILDKRLKAHSDNTMNHDIFNQESDATVHDQFKVINENIIHGTSEIKRHIIANVFKLPKGIKSKYKYVNDILTKETWTTWKPGEQVFISAGTGRGKNTFIKKEMLKHCWNQQIVIFENRQSLMQQQIIDIVSEIDPEALKYRDIYKDNMVIFGSYKNIMIISYQLAALKCMLQDMNFLNFCSGARYLVFDEAHYILDDSSYNKGINFFIEKLA